MKKLLLIALLATSAMINAAATGESVEAASDLREGATKQVNGILTKDEADYFARYAMARDVSELTLTLEALEPGHQTWKDDRTIVHVYTEENWIKYTLDGITTEKDHSLCVAGPCVPVVKTVKRPYDYLVNIRVMAHSTFFINTIKPETDSIKILDIKDPDGNLYTVHAYRNGLDKTSTYDNPGEWFTYSDVPYNIQAVLSNNLKITKLFKPQAGGFWR
jgi:hypothetical protein